MPDSISFTAKSNAPSAGIMAWFVCLSAGLFFFYEFFQLNIFDVINLALRQEFHLNAEQISWMSTSYLWANILFLLPAGFILDRYSVRYTILATMLLCVIGTFGFALSRTFWQAYLFHFLAGIGNAFCFLSCAVLVSRWFPSRRQALVIGTVVTMAFLGGMVAHTPFAKLSDYYGWRKALLIDAGFGGILLAWIFLIVRDYPREIGCVEQSKSKPNSLGFWPALNPQTLLAGLYTACLNLPIMVLCALWGTSYLQTVQGLLPENASNVVSLILVGSIIGCPLVGWLSDKQGQRKPLMIIGAFVTLLITLPLLMKIRLSQMVLCILFFSLGLFTSTQVISYPLIAESNFKKNTGIATGIASVIIMGGAGIGQVLFGLLMQFHAGTISHRYLATDFQYAMWMFPIATLAALLAVLLTRETYCQVIKE